MAVATVGYIDGAGNQVNRQIQFVRPATGLEARFFALIAGGAPSVDIGVIPATEIVVEMESTASKVRNVLQGIENQPDRLLSSFSVHNQNQIVQSIRANPIAAGGRSFEITHHPVLSNGLETVISLCISAV